MKLNSRWYKVAGIFLLLIFSLLTTNATNEAVEKPEKFEAGKVILEHIMDSHDWHLFSFKGHDVSIPLPIILFDRGKPVCFSSSNFHHGQQSYKGYALGFTKESKNKVIKLSGEYAGYTGEITEEMASAIDLNDIPWDISITKNVCALFFSLILIVVLFLYIAKQYKKQPLSAPHGVQSLFEVLIVYVRDEMVRPSLGDKSDKYLPYLLTLFFFIFLNNLLGLIPIFPAGANITGNIAVTAILALITFFITQFSSNKTYWKHIVNTQGAPWWLKLPIPIMPIVELVGVITKPVVLMIRLFANMTGGHIVMLGFVCLIFIFGGIHPAIGYGVSLVSIFFYLFIALLELIVSFIQAFVFTLLTSLYIGMALEEGH
ncbi:MAG: F0F1 ATP synthase subunit A [Bacteroidales bacterium]|jgi:F-type H+-transporting ATPase subunit a|nr:F0F1 ATP synthase subunit A [Bacteroidales bacterium]